MNKHLIVAQLKERIGAIEGQKKTPLASYSLGVDEIDRALKHGGIVAGSCHEIIASQSGPALGFIFHLLATMVKMRGPVLWCSHQQDLYIPGIESFGLKDSDIIFVETKNQQQSLWATEQGLLSSDFSAVVLDIKQLSLSQGRRLKLLAEKHNSTAICMVHPDSRTDLPTVATTRWLITSLISSGRTSRGRHRIVGRPRLSINLLRNIGGLAPLSWTAEFDEHSLRFFIQKNSSWQNEIKSVACAHV